jgi:hypothetical protein
VDVWGPHTSLQTADSILGPQSWGVLEIRRSRQRFRDGDGDEAGKSGESIGDGKHDKAPRFLQSMKRRVQKTGSEQQVVKSLVPLLAMVSHWLARKLGPASPVIQGWGRHWRPHGAGLVSCEDGLAGVFPFEEDRGVLCLAWQHARKMTWTDGDG